MHRTRSAGGRDLAVFVANKKFQRYVKSSCCIKKIKIYFETVVVQGHKRGSVTAKVVDSSPSRGNAILNIFILSL